jgi:flavodoxin short chain
MAKAVLEGLSGAGAEAEIFTVDKISPDAAAAYDRLALGCPSMGAEVLEEAEFEPFFTDLEKKLSGKKIAIFGSYGWGDGEWMRNWNARCEDCGAYLVAEGLIANEDPDEAALAACRELGKSLAG